MGRSSYTEEQKRRAVDMVEECGASQVARILRALPQVARPRVLQVPERPRTDGAAWCGRVLSPQCAPLPSCLCAKMTISYEKSVFNTSKDVKLWNNTS